VFFVTYHEVEKRRRWFIVWIVAVVICATAVFAEVLLRLMHLRLAGLNVTSLLAVSKYVSAVAMCLTTFHWFLTAPSGNRLITVLELRRR